MILLTTLLVLAVGFLFAPQATASALKLFARALIALVFALLCIQRASSSGSRGTRRS